jgi:hypothetical protein
MEKDVKKLEKDAVVAVGDYEDCKLVLQKYNTSPSILEVKALINNNKQQPIPSCVVTLKSHFMYSVLDLLGVEPFASKFCLYNSNFWSAPILFSSAKTTSSAKSMHQRILFCMSLVTSFITKAKR